MLKRRFLLPALILAMLLACAATTQLQPWLLHRLGAVDGSFGVRPMSHDCLGLKTEAAALSGLPFADIRFRVGLFSVRYWVRDGASPAMRYCLGQDVWYGE